MRNWGGTRMKIRRRTRRVARRAVRKLENKPGELRRESTRSCLEIAKHIDNPDAKIRQPLNADKPFNGKIPQQISISANEFDSRSNWK
ncbi:hypothetical protein K0M31_003582, partial [Melipona bicolor]